MGRDTSKKPYVDCRYHHELQNSETKVGYRVIWYPEQNEVILNMGRDTSKKPYVDCRYHHELQNSETKVGYRSNMVPRAE